MENINGREIKEKALSEKVWGIAASIDVYNCNPDKIRCAETIRRFVRELCELLEMKRFEETKVVHFGEDEKVAGYSMVQLIETSLVSGHFANLTNTAYLDVFSCKAYNPDIIRNFAEKYFEGAYSTMHVQFRK
jgi:S-adenosylmethionine/arginine decarboxylase-like enzyme